MSSIEGFSHYTTVSTPDICKTNSSVNNIITYFWLGDYPDMHKKAVSGLQVWDRFQSKKIV
jgi:hypothetical protein